MYLGLGLNKLERNEYWFYYKNGNPINNGFRMRRIACASFIFNMA